MPGSELWPSVQLLVQLIAVKLQISRLGLALMGPAMCTERRASSHVHDTLDPSVFGVCRYVMSSPVIFKQ